MKIERSIVLRAPRARVWQAITNLEEFSRWFGVEAAGAFAPGARLEMTTTDETYKGIVFFVIVEKMEPPNLFSWRWHPGMVEPGVDLSAEPMTLVEFRLSDADGGTRVTVVETGFDRLSLTRRAKAFDENDEGWKFQLRSLERHVHDAA